MADQYAWPSSQLIVQISLTNVLYDCFVFDDSIYNAVTFGNNKLYNQIN